MNDFVFLALLAIVFIVVQFGVLTPKCEEKKELAKGEEDKYLSDNNVTATVEYPYKNGKYAYNLDYEKGIAYRYIVDEKNRMVHIIDKTGTAAKMSFDQVIGCEIMTDSQVTGGVGRAIVGGVLAGDSGAVVGAVTAKPHIMSYKVVLYCLNIQNPIIEMRLIKEKTATKSSDYTCAVNFANKVNASVKAIMAWNAKHL